MKKLTFGTPEEFVPSNFCKNFSYVEKDISYKVSDISFRVTKRGCILELPMQENEHFYGLGLQLKSFDHTGRKYTLRVNSDPTSATGDSHAPVPFFVSTAGYGIYFDTARYAEFYFGRKKPGAKIEEKERKIALSTAELYKASEISSDTKLVVHIPVAQGVTIYIMEGKTITDVVAQYNMLAGGGCDVPEWGLGMLYRCGGHFNQQQVLDTAKYFREKDIPCSIIGLEPGWHTRSYSCSFVWNKALYNDPKQLVDELTDMGYHVNLWEHAFVHPESPMYNDLVDVSADYLVWNGLAPDFTQEKAVETFTKYHQENVLFDKIDGFKLDECDGSDFVSGWTFPNCSIFPCGAEGEQYHSVFGTLYMQTMLKALDGKPTLSEVRNAGALCASYPFVLYSDLYDHKDFIRGVANAGFSGILWTPEVRDAKSKEEFIRRLQTVVFSTQCLINAWYCEKMPWLDFDCEEEVRALLKERERLIPRLKKAFEKYKTTGVAPIRALVSDYTDDPETYSIYDEYLIGDDMLVAPIIFGTEKRKVYIPAGDWVDYFTGEKVENGYFETDTKGIPVFIKK